MILVGNHALPASEHIKARIVEGSYGMEKTETDGFRHRILPDKNRKAKDGSGAFNQKGGDKYALQKPHDSFPGIQIHGFLYDFPSA